MNGLAYHQDRGFRKKSLDHGVGDPETGSLGSVSDRCCEIAKAHAARCHLCGEL